MIARRWQLTAVYLGVFGLGVSTSGALVASATPLLGTPMVTALQAPAFSVTAASATNTPGRPLSASEMAGTIGAGWWEDFLSFLGDLSKATLAVAIVISIEWLCSQEQVSCP